MTDLDPNKFLAELTLGAVKGLTEPLKNKIKKYWLKREYGVTIEPDEGKKLQDIANEEFYKIFKKYLGEHWSIKLIKVGIYISNLNEEGKKERAGEIQKEAYRKYGPKGAKIIHLASTGILVPIMDHIINLRLYKGATCIVLNQEFDKILDEWDQISIPVSRGEVDSLRQKIESVMLQNHPIFFVYAAGSVSVLTQLILAKMNNDRLFQGKYLMTSKIKVVENTEYCVWIFERIQDGEGSIISKKVGSENLKSLKK